MDWIATLRADATNDEAFDRALAQAVARQRWRDAWAIGEEFASRERARWELVADALEQLAGIPDDASERAELLTTLGDLWSEQLSRPDQAIVHYQAAFKVDRGATRAIERARDLFRTQQNWTMVQRLFQVQARVSREPEERARLLTEAGRVQRDALRDEVGARDYFEQALRALPGYRPATDALEGHDTPSGHAELDELRARLSSASGPPRAELLYRIAELLLAADEPDEDPSTYLEEAVSLEPGSPEGMRVVADHLRRRAQWPELCDVLERIAASRAAAEVRSQAALEAVRIAEDHLKDASRARSLLSQARAAAPAAPDVVDAAVAWFERHEEWSEVEAVLKAAVARSAGGGHDVRWHGQLGALYADRLGDLERAEPHFRRIRMLRGSDDAMLAFYAAYHREREEPRKLLAVLQTRRERATTPEEMRQLSEEMAQVAEVGLEDAVRAVDVWTWFLREQPDDAFARRELRRLLVATERWNRLLEFLKEELRRADDAPLEQRLELHLQIARIYRDHVQLPMFEAQAYQAVLALDPACEEAVHVVRDRLSASQRWLEAATVLDRAAEQAGEPELAFAWAQEAGAIWMQHGDDLEAARASFEVAAAARPDHAETLSTLEQLAARQGDGQSRLALLRRRAALLPEAERLAALEEALRAAETQVDRREILGDLVEATESRQWSWVAELATLWAQAGGHTEAAGVLQRHVDAMGADVSPSAHLELAHQLRQTEDPEAAVPVYEQVLTQSPGLPAAVEGALEALAAAEAWGAVEEFAARHDAWQSAAQRVATTARGTGDVERYRQAARFCLDHLDDPARAVDLLEAALEIAPTSPEVAAALGCAYQRTGDAHGRSQMLELQAQAATGAAKRDLQLELADVAANELEAPGAALGWLLAAFDTDPLRVDVRDDALESARALDRVAEWSTAVRRGAAALPEGPERLDHERCVARVAETDLEDAELAIEFLQRVVAQVPDDAEAWETLQRLHAARARWDDASVALEARFRGTDDEAAREILGAELLAIRVRHLDGAPGVVEQLRRLLGRDPEEVGPLEPLAEALVESERFAEAAAVATLQARLCSQQEERFERLATAAAWRAQDGGTNRSELIDEFAQLVDAAASAERAIEALQPLLDLTVDEPELRGRIADVVEPAARAAERWEIVAAVLRDRVQRATGDEATAWTRELARVEEEERESFERAAEAWRFAIEHLPLTAADVAAADRLSVAASADEALIRAWSQRIARDASDPGLTEWAADPDVFGAREALDRRLRVDVHTEPSRIGGWVAAVRTGWLAADNEQRYLALAEALLADERLGGNVRGRLHAEFGLSLYEQGGTEAAALAHLDSACRSGGAFERVIEAVLALGRELEREEQVSEALEAALERVPDAAMTSRLHHRLGAIYRDQGAPAEAIRHYESAVFIDDDPSDALVALDDLYAETGAHEERAAALVRLAERRAGADAAELRLEAARVHAGTLDDTDRAIELAATARHADETGEATRLLRAWLRARARWDDLAALLAEVVDAGQSDEDVLGALRERARLLEDPLGRRREAASCWERVRVLVPSDSEALEELDRLYGALAEPEARIDVLRTRLEAAEGSEDLEVRRSLVRAHAEQGDLAQAVAASRALLDDHPADAPTLELLEALGDRAYDAAVLELLVDAYGAAGRWADASRTCRAAADGDLAVDQQLIWLERAQRIESEENGDGAAAYALALERYRRSGGASPTLAAVRALATDVDGGATLAMLLESRFSAEEATTDELRGLLELASDGASLGVPVRDVALGLLEQAPEDAAALRAALADPPSEEQEIDLLFRFVPVAEPAERGAARVRLADALHVAARREEELAVVLEVEAEAPEPALWARRADGLFHALGRYDALASRLESRASAAEGELSSQAWIELSTIQREHLQTPEDALRSVKHAAAIVGLTPAVEAALDAVQLDLSTPPGVARDAALLVVELRSEAGGGPELVEAIERALVLCDPEQRDGLRRRLADAFEQAGDASAALQAWADVLRSDPGARQAADRVVELAGTLEAWADAAAVLREVGLSAGASGAALLDEAADIHERHLDDLASALDVARSALAAEPTAARFDEVERLLYRAESWDELIAWHRERATDAGSPDAVATQLHRAARVAWICAGDLERAVDSLLLAFERAPSRADLRADLDAILTEQERWDVLSDVLSSAAAASSPPDVTAVRRLAALRADQLADPLGAARTLRDAAESVDGLEDEVEQAYGNAGAWQELAEWLDARIEVTTGEARASLIARLAVVRAEELGDLESALAQALPSLEKSFRAPLFDRAVEWAGAGIASDAELRRLREVARSAGDAERELAALACMASLAIRPEDAEEAASARADLLARTKDGSAQALAALLEGLETAPDAQALWTRALGLASNPDRALELAHRVTEGALLPSDPAAAVSVCYAVGLLALDVADDPAMGESLLLRAFDADPSASEPLEALERWYAQSGRHGERAELIERAAAHAEGPRRVELLTDLAGVAEKGLEDTERALQAWTAVRDVEPEHPRALSEIARLSEAAGQWQTAVDARLQAAANQQGAERAKTLVEAVRSALEHGADPSGFVETLEDARSAAPDSAEAHELLCDVLERGGQWQPLVDHLTAAAREADDARAAAMLARAAGIRAADLEDPDGGVDSAREAVTRLDNAEYRALYREMLGKAGRYRELVTALEAALQTGELEDRAGAHIEISRIAREAIGDDELAEHHLAAAQVSRPGDPDVALELARLRIAAGRGDDAAEVLGAAAEEADGPRLVEILQEQARALLLAGRRSSAMAVLERAFELDPDSDETFGQLRDEFERVRDWEGLQDLLHRRAHRATGADAAPVWRRIASVARVRLKQPEMARHALEQAHAADPDDDTTAIQLLRAYIDAREPDEALPLLEEVTARAQEKGGRSDLHRLLYLRGRIEESREAWETALDAYQQCFKLDAGYVPNLLALGRVLMALERPEEALKVLQTALVNQKRVEQPARRVELFFLLGSVREALGDDIRASDMYERALQVDRDHEPSRARLDALKG